MGYSLECFTDVFVTRCVAHSEAVWVAKGIASDGSHMCLGEQIKCEVVAVVDGDDVVTALVVLAIEAGALREEVEGTVGTVDLEAGNLAGEFNDEVAATLEGLPHLLHAVLRECVGSLGSFLADGARSAGVLSLQLVAALDNPFRCCDVTDTPSRHGISL